MKDVTKEKIEQLKAQHSEIFEGCVTFNDSDDKLHTVEFIYRKPTTADLEAHTKLAQKNPIVANLNVLQSLIVHPESGSVINSIRDFPMAYGRFVDEAISPFFGANVTVKNKKL